jgi:hypothetical protein
MLVDVSGEYARHVGHADLVRESVDGLVGEDPPGKAIAYSLPNRDKPWSGRRESNPHYQLGRLKFCH